jgi:hypothetical protein
VILFLRTYQRPADDTQLDLIDIKSSGRDADTLV